MHIARQLRRHKIGDICIEETDTILTYQKICQILPSWTSYGVSIIGVLAEN